MPTITWANGVSGDWTDASDWAAQQSPGSGDNVGIGPGIAGDTAYTVTATNEMAASLLVATGGFGTLSVGGLLAVGGPVSVASGSLLLQPDGTVTSAAALTLGQAGAGASQGTLTAGIDSQITAHSLGIFDNSTLSIGAGGAVALGSGTIAPFEVSVGANASLTGDSGTIAGSVDSLGLIDVQAVQAGESADALAITGTLDLPGVLGAPIGTGGELELAAGATLAVGSDLTLYWQVPLSLGAGAKLTVGGNLSALYNPTLGAGAVLTVGGTLSMAGLFSASGASIGAGDLVVGGATLDGVSLSQTGGGADDIYGDVVLTNGAALSVPQLTLGNSPTGNGWDATIEAGSTFGVANALTLEGDPNDGAPVAFEAPLVAAGGSVTAGSLSIYYNSTVDVSGNGAVAIGGAAPVADAVAVASTATLDAGWGTIEANLALGGTFFQTSEGANPDVGVPYSPVAGFDTFAVTGSLAGQGTVDLRDEFLQFGQHTVILTGATLTVGSAVGFAGSLTLENGSLLVLGTGDMPSALITVHQTPLGPGPSNSATVDLTRLGYQASNLPEYNAATGLLTVGTATLDVGLGFSNGAFGVGQDSGVGTDVTIPIACFATGTRLRAENGEVAVEAVAAGDYVYTQNGRLAPVRWVGFREVCCRRHPRPEWVWPVRVARDAFGPGRPCRDLWLSPDHALFVDGVLIPVRHLIDGDAIAQFPRDAVTYWHVELDRHDVVLAEGLACESFLDTGNRAAFANGGACVRLHPDFAQRSWDADACAPLVVAGPALARARAALPARPLSRARR